MAEFQDVAKQWKRMCKHFHAPQTCHGCPIAERERCFEACMEQEIDIAQMEKDVMAWAAENPEPVYPMWLEWLTTQAVLVAGERGCYGNILPTNKLFTPIPADIAQKLGIEPKEGL